MGGEGSEIIGAKELGREMAPVVGGVGGEVGGGAVVTDEADHAGVLEAVRLGRAGGDEDPVADVTALPERDLVVVVGNPSEPGHRLPGRTAGTDLAVAPRDRLLE